jgi:uncharacterized Ntn-hydrolase superfamily protein
MTNPYLAIDALAHLDHKGVDAALEQALAADPEAERRQVIVIDAAGRTVGWTGAKCTGFAGHVAADGVAVAGNMLVGEEVLREMLVAYRRALRSGLALALLEALKAGAAAGGDSRGIGSAAMRVQGDQVFADVDLRVDHSSDPLRALAEVLEQTTAGPYAEFFAHVLRR